MAGNNLDNELIELHWDTTSSHRVLLTRRQVRDLLGYEVEQLQQRPIIDEWFRPGEQMEGNLPELAEALKRLESGPGNDPARMITFAEPAGE